VVPTRRRHRPHPSISADSVPLFREDTARGRRRRHAGEIRDRPAVPAGECGPQRAIVPVNAAEAIATAGKVATFLAGVAIGTVSIDSGAATRKVTEFNLAGTAMPAVLCAVS